MIFNPLLSASTPKNAFNGTSRGGVILPKLTIGQPDDKYEKEADAVADRVMHMPSSSGEQMKYATSEPDIQMKCAKCEEEEKLQMKPAADVILQMKPDNGNTMAPEGLSARLKSKSSGQPLPEKVSHEMSSKIGRDFSNVKIHTDSNAVQMSEEIGAQAFTHGSDIYFNKGKYDPDRSNGKHLLAHELTHVVQQEGKVLPKFIQRKLGDGHDLVSVRFAGNLTLEEVFDNERYIRFGSHGDAVIILQQALMDIGYSLPKFGADGDFGSETLTAIKEFQTEFGLKADGIVGPMTMSIFDDLFSPEFNEFSEEGEEDFNVADGDNSPQPTVPAQSKSLNQLGVQLGGEEAEGIIQTDLKDPPTKVKPPIIDTVSIDLSSQNLTIKWSNGKVRGPYPISTGRGCPNTAKNPCVNPKRSDQDTYCTPVGTFSVEGLGGEGYTSSKGDAMSWYVAFVKVRGIGIHNAQTVTGAPASHGCVRAVESVAKLIHNNVTNKSKIIVSGKAPTKAWSLNKEKTKKGYPGCPLPKDKKKKGKKK